MPGDREVRDRGAAVEGDEIRGTVTVTPPEGKAQQLPWVARRGSAASWFRTTGVNIK
jgi:hypothetical protein